MVDCKVKVRKWILISNPTRWNQADQRAVVYSPMLQIPKEVSHVPVKRFSREEDDSVCFVPKCDIEKDSNKIYGKMHVSRNTLVVAAHGVAIASSSLDDDFQYDRGDKFWIFVEGNTTDYEVTSTVPVINLRTFESGIIAAGQVCWFPQVRGPNEELWTLGGIIRDQKLEGSRRFSYWSFGIRQKLNGRPATTASLPIPTKGTTAEDIYELKAADRRSLFIKRYQCLTLESSAEMCSIQPRQIGRLEPSTVDSSVPRTASSSPSPSAESKGREMVTAMNVEERPFNVDISVFGRIYAMASSQWPYSRLQRRLLRPQKPQLPSTPRNTRRLSIDTDGCSDDDLSSISSFEDSMPTSSHTPRKSSTLEPTGRGKCSIKSDLTWDDDAASCPSILLGMSRGPLYGRNREWKASGPHGCEPAPSFQDIHFGNSLDEISERYAQARQDPEGCVEAFHCDRNATLCDRRNPNCSYSMLYTAKHFHSPSGECLDTHEHCVSRLLPLPADAGDCIVRLKLDRHHRCCRWKSEDCISWPQNRRRAIDHPKLKEARQEGIAIYDMSDGVKWEQPTIELRPYGQLTDSGRDVIDAFDGGVLPIDANLSRFLGNVGDLVQVFEC